MDIQLAKSALGSQINEKRDTYLCQRRELDADAASESSLTAGDVPRRWHRGRVLRVDASMETVERDHVDAATTVPDVGTVQVKIADGR